MFLNWGLETSKWKLLISKFEKIKFINAFCAVWSGLTINNWIPNRLAEFLGRILYISPENKPKAIFSTLIGNVSQLVMTVFWGSLGLLLWIGHLSKCQYSILIIAVLIINIVLVYFYLNMKLAHRLIMKIKFLHFISQYSEIILQYKKNELLKIAGFSCLRYFVYLFQYYLLLVAFGINAQPVLLLASVSLIFLVQAVLPSVTFTEIGIRGATILFFAGKYSTANNEMLAAAYCLWLINIIIPTLFGGIFILGIKNKRLVN